MNARTEITDLTVCRAFFAAWVFAYHVDLYLNFSAWLGPFSGLIRHGYLGVDGFFILSGLILARVHPELSRSAKGAFKFWGKRLARIYPVHFVTLLIFGAILLAGAAQGIAPRDPERFALSAFLQNLFLVHGWGFASQGAWNYPSWSVSTEWAGYLLFPVLWLIISYFDELVAIQIVIAGFAVLGLIVTEHAHNLNLTFAEGLIRFFPEFILGMATARFVPRYADFAPLRTIAVSGAVLTFDFRLGGLGFVDGARPVARSVCLHHAGRCRAPCHAGASPGTALAGPAFLRILHEFRGFRIAGLPMVPPPKLGPGKPRPSLCGRACWPLPSPLRSSCMSSSRFPAAAPPTAGWIAQASPWREIRSRA